jgi:enoyl-CoA hydratase/carnithine racemase
MGQHRSVDLWPDQRISAAEAYEWRLVEEVAEPGKAFDAAMALAAKVAASHRCRSP